MCRIIISVSWVNETREVDLEIPADCPANQLSMLLIAALKPDINENLAELYQIEAHPLGRILLPSESLSDVGCWDGTHLILKLRSSGLPTSSQSVNYSVQEHRVDDGILYVEPEWEPFSDITIPDAHISDEDADTDEPDGYIWKELD